MVEITMAYEGSLRCSAVHGPSGDKLFTDAPKDNMGKGEAFSPTDLVATALGTCMLTTMGIVAQRNAIDMGRATAKVTKEMITTPARRVGRLSVTINIPASLSDEDQTRLKNAAMACPVHKSLNPDVQIPVTFTFG